MDAIEVVKVVWPLGVPTSEYERMIDVVRRAVVGPVKAPSKASPKASKGKEPINGVKTVSGRAVEALKAVLESKRGQKLTVEELTKAGVSKQAVAKAFDALKKSGVAVSREPGTKPAGKKGAPPYVYFIA